jgi:Zn-dependent peptidase ImmA (M78 family)
MTSPGFAYILDWVPQSESRLEGTATAALQACNELLPDLPGAIPIERFVEETFGFNETYDELEPGVLGEINFGTEDRPFGIRIAQHLGVIDESSPAIEQERRMTIAHECGHGLAHSALFSARLRALREPCLPGFEFERSHFICRQEDISTLRDRPTQTVITTHALEWEANYLMAALLLPRTLLTELLGPLLRYPIDGVSPVALRAADRANAALLAAKAFGVPTELARWRIASVFSDVAHPDFFQLIRKKPPGQTPGEGWAQTRQINPRAKTNRQLI